MKEGGMMGSWARSLIGRERLRTIWRQRGYITTYRVIVWLIRQAQIPCSKTLLTTDQHSYSPKHLYPRIGLPQSSDSTCQPRIHTKASHMPLVMYFIHLSLQRFPTKKNDRASNNTYHKDRPPGNSDLREPWYVSINANPASLAYGTTRAHQKN